MPTEIKLNVSKEILKELLMATKLIMSQYKLGGSDLVNSMEWTYKDDAFIMMALPYFQWVDTGRKPRAKKVPIEALIKWIRKKNIKPLEGQSINSLAYAIQNSIYKVGIKARRYTSPVIDEAQSILEFYIADYLAAEIAGTIATELTFTLGKTV